MEHFASPGGATLELVEGYVAVTPLGPVPVEGLADSVRYVRRGRARRR